MWTRDISVFVIASCFVLPLYEISVTTGCFVQYITLW